MNYSYRKISKHLCVGIGTVHRVIKYFEAMGDVKTKTNSLRSHVRALDDHQELIVIGA